MSDETVTVEVWVDGASYPATISGETWTDVTSPFETARDVLGIATDEAGNGTDESVAELTVNSARYRYVFAGCNRRSIPNAQRTATSDWNWCTSMSLTIPPTTPACLMTGSSRL